MTAKQWTLHDLSSATKTHTSLLPITNLHTAYNCWGI